MSRARWGFIVVALVGPRGGVNRIRSVGIIIDGVVSEVGVSSSFGERVSVRVSRDLSCGR